MSTFQADALSSTEHRRSKKFEDARAEEFVPRIAQGKENGSAGGGPEEEEGSNQRAPGKGNSSTRGGQAPLPHV